MLNKSFLHLTGHLINLTGNAPLNALIILIIYTDLSNKINQRRIYQLLNL